MKNTKKNTRRHFLRIASVGFWSAILAACSPASDGSPAPTSVLVETQTPDSLPAAPTAQVETETQPAANTAQPAASPTVLSTPQEPAITLDPNRGFTPTDPAMVNLVSGKPQLFEFFAYW